ncbi:MAG: hypothetical protein D3X82_07970 [Candidatus Leucobacter sulfamidivorax]|nr:hypothetical protein [Candidatus Leucobacter sulfamidivorax]
MKELDLGPTGLRVAENVAQERNRLNLTYAALEKRLEDSHHRIPALGIRRIEARARRVDVDDLIALSVALNVSPIDLLFRSDGSRPAATGLPKYASAEDAIAWAKQNADLSRPSLMKHWALTYYDAGMRLERARGALAQSDTQQWERERAHEEVGKATELLTLAWNRLKELQTTYGEDEPLPTIGGIMPDIRGIDLEPNQVPPPFVTLGNNSDG